MELIINWVKNIIFIVLITTFLEMFLPDNEMRKYVRVVMGFFIIAIFISPLASLFNGSFQSFYNIIPEREMDIQWDQLKEQGEQIEASNQTILSGFFTEKVTSQIKDMVELEFPGCKNNINVMVDKEYNLKEIQVSILSNNVENVEIKPIAFDEEESDQGQSTADIMEDVVEVRQKMLKIENKISNVFQVSPRIIKITYNNGSEQIEIN